MTLTSTHGAVCAGPESIDAIVGRAEALLRSGDAREARALVVTSLPAIERHGNRAVLRKAVNLLGAADFEMGEFADAEAAFHQALDLARRDGDDLLLARATNNLGAIANVRGQREKALVMYALAVAAYQRLGQARGLAHAYHNMAITFRHAGLLDRADEHERRAIEFAREAPAPHVVTLARIGRAEISLLRGDARLAEATALLVARELIGVPDPIERANALRVAGAARLALGNTAGAHETLSQALALARRHGVALTEAETLRVFAELHARNGAMFEARELAGLAIRLFTRLGARRDRDSLEAWTAALGERLEVTPSP
ncbi:MAG: tetratricopeptide repeat protein [bacterium]